MNTIQEHKRQTNLSELLFYMEEMYSMDMLSEKGTDIYERYKFGHQMTISERSYIYSQIEKWFFEKF